MLQGEQESRVPTVNMSGRSRFVHARFSKLALLAVMSVVAFAGSVVAAPPASAGQNITVWYGADRGHFQAYGEVVSACDGNADGWGVMVFYYRADQNLNGVVMDRNGSGNGCVKRDLSIPEGVSVRIRLCHRSPSNPGPFACTAWAWGVA
jgi:hypothetical protein